MQKVPVKQPRSLAGGADTHDAFNHFSMISRGLAMSGSRDPYVDGGTNEMRDRDGR